MHYQITKSGPMQYYPILLPRELLHFDQAGKCLWHLVTPCLNTEARTSLLPRIIISHPTSHCLYLLFPRLCLNITANSTKF